MKAIALRAISLLLCLSLALSLRLYAKAATPSLSAKSAILIDASDASVLFEKNASERMGMASTTKIMTALVATELLELDCPVVIPKEAVNVEGSSVYLTQGEILTLRELLYALLLSSANDAATAIAIAAAGSVAAFAHKMNERALSLGLCDTHFVNPHGLYDEMHYTTARDLATISAEALKNPTLREIFASKKATIPQGVTSERPWGESERYLYNHNKMLSRYEGAIGMKTGFTKKTGRCLVSAAERDGLTLISVTLNAPDDWNDHAAMLDYGFSTYESVTLFDTGEYAYPFLLSGGKEGYLLLSNASPITLTLPRSGRQVEYRIESCFRFAIAPVQGTKQIATLVLCFRDKTLRIPLLSAYTAPSANKK